MYYVKKKSKLSKKSSVMFLSIHKKGEIKNEKNKTIPKV